jgi:hypothetical protein
MGRRLRTRWDLLKPDMGVTVQDHQARQKRWHDGSVRLRHWTEHDGKKNFRTGESWIRGVIVEKIGPLIYLVDIPGGRLWKRHVDHIKDLHVPLEENETIPRPVPVEVGDTTTPEPEPLEVVPEAVPEPAAETVDTGAPATQEVPSSGTAPEHPTPEPKAARKLPDNGFSLQSSLVREGCNILNSELCYFDIMCVLCHLRISLRMV